MTYADKLKAKKADISVFYKSVGDLKLPLNVYLPDGFKENKKYKCVIAIHGGGWTSLKKTPDNWDGGWMAGNVKYYAEKGYVGIVFSYRDIRYTKDCHAGLLLQDCCDAIKYISDNFSFADVKGGVIMGDSAGGHLALCLAMGLGCGADGLILPEKIAAYNPVTDCVCDKWNYLAAEPLKYSPLHNIKKAEGKILVMHGNRDDVVDINDSITFTEKMKKAGNDIELIEVADAKHAFILFGYTAKEEDVLVALKRTDEHFGL